MPAPIAPSLLSTFVNNGNGFNDGVTVYNQPVPANSFPGFEYTTDLDLLLGDFDADGHADLVLRTTESDPVNPGEPLTAITVLYGNGRGAFSPATVSNDNNYFRLSAADMNNNDGTSDIAGDSFGPLTIFYGQPSRTFTTTTVPAAQMGAESDARRRQWRWAQRCCLCSLSSQE